MTVRAAAELRLAAPIVDVQRRVRAVLASMDVLVRADDGVRFEARTALSGRSFGERLVIAVRDVPGSSGTMVSIGASSWLRFTWVDYGATRRLVETVAQAVAAPSPPPTPAVGTPIVNEQWRWVGVGLCAISAVLAAVSGGGTQRMMLLWVAAGCAALWTLGVWTGSIRVRRRGVVPPTWLPPTQTAGAMLVGFPTASALLPAHPPFVLLISAVLACMTGGLAVAFIATSIIVRLQRRRAAA